MKQLHISQAKEGMTLGRNLYDENNKIILKRGAFLTESIIRKLTSLGYSILCIKDDKTDDIDIRECLSREAKHKTVKALKSLDFYNYKKIDYKDVTNSAKEIVESVSKSKNIAFDLLDIRNDENYEYNQSIAVAELATAIAKEYTEDGKKIFNEENILALTHAALLHNIGKSCKNQKVREKINEKEYIESDNPKYAYKLLHDAIIPKASVISVGILFHKTDENGNNCPTGYEEFIKKNKINLFSKILHVADSYITLISKENSYNLNIGPAEAMEIIRDTSETLFDKDVVNTFLRKVPIYPDGALLFLSNGEEGIVIDNNIGETGLNYRPVIKTDNGNIYNLMDEKYKHLTIIPNNKNELKYNIKN